MYQALQQSYPTENYSFNYHKQARLLQLHKNQYSEESMQQNSTVQIVPFTALHHQNTPYSTMEDRFDTNQDSSNSDDFDQFYSIESVPQDNFYTGYFEQQYLTLAFENLSFHSQRSKARITDYKNQNAQQQKNSTNKNYRILQTVLHKNVNDQYREVNKNQGYVSESGNIYRRRTDNFDGRQNFRYNSNFQYEFERGRTRVPRARHDRNNFSRPYNIEIMNDVNRQSARMYRRQLQHQTAQGRMLQDDRNHQNPKYDEMKTYYDQHIAGAEREQLMRQRLRRVLKLNERKSPRKAPKWRAGRENQGEWKLRNIYESTGRYNYYSDQSLDGQAASPPFVQQRRRDRAAKKSRQQKQSQKQDRQHTFRGTETLEAYWNDMSPVDRQPLYSDPESFKDSVERFSKDTQKHLDPQRTEEPQDEDLEKLGSEDFFVSDRSTIIYSTSAEEEDFNADYGWLQNRKKRRDHERAVSKSSQEKKKIQKTRKKKKKKKEEEEEEQDQEINKEALGKIQEYQKTQQQQQLGDLIQEGEYNSVDNMQTIANSSKLQKIQQQELKKQQETKPKQQRQKIAQQILDEDEMFVQDNDTIIYSSSANTSEIEQDQGLYIHQRRRRDHENIPRGLGTLHISSQSQQNSMEMHTEGQRELSQGENDRTGTAHNQPYTMQKPQTWSSIQQVSPSTILKQNEAHHQVLQEKQQDSEIRRSTQQIQTLLRNQQQQLYRNKWQLLSSQEQSETQNNSRQINNDTTDKFQSSADYQVPNAILELTKQKRKTHTKQQKTTRKRSIGRDFFVEDDDTIIYSTSAESSEINQDQGEYIHSKRRRDHARLPKGHQKEKNQNQRLGDNQGASQANTQNEQSIDQQTYTLLPSHPMFSKKQHQNRSQLSFLQDSLITRNMENSIENIQRIRYSQNIQQTNHYQQEEPFDLNQNPDLLYAQQHFHPQVQSIPLSLSSQGGNEGSQNTF